MPLNFSAEELVDMILLYGECRGNGNAALGLYTERFPAGRRPNNGRVIVNMLSDCQIITRWCRSTEEGLSNYTTNEVENRCISFMEIDSTPYAELLLKLRGNKRPDTEPPDQSSTDSYTGLKSLKSPQSEMYSSISHTPTTSLGRHDTALLDMVRERNRELQEARDQPLELPRDDISETSSIEPCVHGMSHRITDRSMSRSRFSRISTRRDMDIPSILAFTTTDTPPTNLPLGIPAFQQKESSPKLDEIPRWSIRRSLCPVCSQKWKDRSYINKIRSSGLKRNALQEIPSVIAPARLRSAGSTSSHRPVLVAVDDTRVSPGLRNTSATWQLIRARRMRPPKPQIPLVEAGPSDAAAPQLQKDLNNRVNNFLSK